MARLLALVVVFAIVVETEAFYESGSNVVPIKDQQQFQREVLESDFLWAVEFYREVGSWHVKLHDHDFVRRDHLVHGSD